MLLQLRGQKTMTDSTAGRKRPLGLGAKKVEQRPEQAHEEVKDDGAEETMFQLPDGDLSEEAEIMTVFNAAQSLAAEFWELEGVDRVKMKISEDNIRSKAIKLFSGVIHECDLMLKMKDTGERTEQVPAIIYEMFGDSLYLMQGIFKNNKMNYRDRYLRLAKQVYKAGLEKYPDSLGLVYSKARLDLIVACLHAQRSYKRDDSDALYVPAKVIKKISRHLPKLPSEDYQIHLSKLWVVLDHFVFLLHSLDDTTRLKFSRMLERIMPDVPEFEDQIRWLALKVEVAELLSNFIEKYDDMNPINKLNRALKDSKVLIDKIQIGLTGKEDREGVISFFELVANYYLLEGSYHARKDRPNAEKKSYKLAFNTYWRLHKKYGVEIPWYITDLIR